MKWASNIFEKEGVYLLDVALIYKDQVKAWGNRFTDKDDARHAQDLVDVILRNLEFTYDYDFKKWNRDV